MEQVMKAITNPQLVGDAILLNVEKGKTEAERLVHKATSRFRKKRLPTVSPEAAAEALTNLQQERLPDTQIDMDVDISVESKGKNPL